VGGLEGRKGGGGKRWRGEEVEGRRKSNLSYLRHGRSSFQNEAFIPASLCHESSSAVPIRS
jgi:hypothetical protein